MATDEKRVNSNSPDKEEEEEEEEEDDEALSLSGLPVDEDENQSISKEEDDAHQPKEEFNFNSSGGSALAESEMCAADEVFFQGQILPFRHSVSFETGFAMFRVDSRSVISRSQSMDHRYTGANFPSGSTTRSSSISSDHNSLSSGSSSSTTKTPLQLLKHKPPLARTRNQFHSHPSPTPQIRIQRGNSTPHRRQKSTLWSFFQVGLIPTPEIKLPDFKIRSNNNISTSSKNFGSRNSTNSTSSTIATSINENGKKKQWSMLFDRNGALFGGGCRSCSVDQTVHPRINVSIKNCSSSSGIGVNCETFGKKERGDVTNKKKKSMQQQQQKKGKQAMSRNRTFEWLKQLSLEGGPEDESSAAA